MTSAENVNSSQGSAITSLQNSVTGLQNSKADASAVQALDTRVTSVEGKVTSQASAITSVRVAQSGTVNYVPFAAFDGGIGPWTIYWDSAGIGATLVHNRYGVGYPGGSAGNISTGWPAGTPINGPTFIAFGSSKRATLPYGTTRVCIAAEINKAFTGVDVFAGVECFDAFGNYLDGPNVQLIRHDENTGAAWSRRHAFLWLPAGTVSVIVWFRLGTDQASSSDRYVWITRPLLTPAFQDQVDAPEWTPSPIGFEASTNLLLDAMVTDDGRLRARGALATDVDGRIGGLYIENDGQTAQAVFLADIFRVVSPDSAEGMEWQDGYLRVYRPNTQAIVGNGFGPDTLTWFIGPNVGPQNASKANASLWADSNGNVGMTGLVHGSLLSASAMSMGSTRIYCGGDRLAPFTIRDARYYISPGTNASRILTIDGFVSPNHGTGYNWKRFARHKMDVWIDVLISGDTGNETAIVEVEYDGNGSWIQIQSVTFNCGYRASFPMMFRYTTLESWNTLAFRVRTTQNRTEAIRMTIDVANYNESGNPPGSNSGVTGGSGLPPPPPPPGDDWCVDYETTMLPSGTYVRDLKVGTLVECWDENGENPSVVLKPLRAMNTGYERCYQVMVGDEALIIQSESTPMVLRDGRVVRTAELVGEEVLMRDSLTWARVTDLIDMGVRKVAKPDFGNAMFFAGLNSVRTIATHNAYYKP